MHPRGQAAASIGPTTTVRKLATFRRLTTSAARGRRSVAPGVLALAVLHKSLAINLARAYDLRHVCDRYSPQRGSDILAQGKAPRCSTQVACDRAWSRVRSAPRMRSRFAPVVRVRSLFAPKGQPHVSPGQRPEDRLESPSCFSLMNGTFEIDCLLRPFRAFRYCASLTQGDALD